MPHPLLVVVGPTGSGKSDLALFLAAELPAEIVNCDSLQIYRGFDIGTAKVGAAARAAVPHHLIDIADPTQLFTAGEYSRVGRETLRDIAARGRVPVVAGGTGFYLRALLDGLAAAPRRDDALRERLDARETARPGSMHRLLRRLDAASSLRIHANDRQKLIRALEVILRARKPLTEVIATPPEPLEGFDLLKIGLNPRREELHDALNARTEAMFAAGLLEEVRTLLTGGLSGSEKPFESLGYKQALAVVRNEMDLPAAIASTQLQTRQYAKRQMTWFRRETGVVWIDGFGRSPETRQVAVDSVRSWYKQFQP